MSDTNAAVTPLTTTSSESSCQSLTDHAYLRLEEMLVTLRLPPGKVLSEARLSQMLNIGRTPVREALQRLARERLIKVMPRRGILVSEFDVRDHLCMLEVRREIERLIARSAAARADDEQRAEFRRLAAAMAQASSDNDDIQFMRLDRSFNKLANDAARNEYARQTIALMAGLGRRFWFLHHRNVDDLPIAIKHHITLATAIAAGDTAAAAAASDSLLDYIEGITHAALEWYPKMNLAPPILAQASAESR